MTVNTIKDGPAELDDRDLDAVDGAFLRSTIGGVLKGTKRVLDTALGVVPNSVSRVRSSFQGGAHGYDGPTSMGGGSSRYSDFSTTKHRH
ncbi:MAG: hypothetical protein AAGF44_06790 [Pseudomonadota bacterium]